MKHYPYLSAFLAVAVATSAASAPWPTRPGRALLNQWESLSLDHRAAVDAALVAGGGPGDASIGASPPARLDVAGSAGSLGPAAWWAFDAANGVLLFRLRVVGSPLDPATQANGIINPVLIPLREGPWASGTWSLLFDADGDGLREAGLVLDGSSGNSPRDIAVNNPPTWPNPTANELHSGDDLLLLRGTTADQRLAIPTIAAGRVTDPMGLEWNVESAIQAVTGAGGATPPNGFTWDFGTTRCTWHSSDLDWGTGWLIDVQFPIAALAGGGSGLVVHAPTPLTPAWATGLESGEPVSRDISGTPLVASSLRRLAFGDVVTLSDGARSAPILGAMTASNTDCGNALTITAQVADTLRPNPANVPGHDAVPSVIDTIRSVQFEMHADSDCNARDDESTGWRVLESVASSQNPDVDGFAGVDGVPSPDTLLNEWGTRWDTSSLADGCWLVRATVTDDDGHVTRGTRLLHRIDRTDTCTTSEVATPETYSDAWLRDQDAILDRLTTETVRFAVNGLIPGASYSVAFFGIDDSQVGWQLVTADRLGQLVGSFEIKPFRPTGLYTAAIYRVGLLPPIAFSPSSTDLLEWREFRVTEDRDLDGITDLEEDAIGLNRIDPDTDRDLLVDGEELRWGVDGVRTNPFDLDSDDDGLSDGDEMQTRGTDPSRADSDGDGVQDGTELGITAGVADPDGGGPLLGSNLNVFRPDLDPASITNPSRADSDGGGVDDGGEDVNFNGRRDGSEGDPLAAGDDVDADRDGIVDAAEASLGLSALAADADSDGLTDGEERSAGLDGFVTDPLDADSDDDGLSDGEESRYGQPLDPDSDDDGLLDGVERGRATGVPDPDGLGPARGTNAARFRGDAEPSTTSDPSAADSDGAGAADSDEDINLDGRVDAGECDPADPGDDLACMFVDADGDGLSDRREALLSTNPAVADTDGDLLADGAEVTAGTDPNDRDTDDDGLSDRDEIEAFLTDPLARDTDGDGVQDGTERARPQGIADPDGAGPLRGTGLGFQRDLDVLRTTNPLLADHDGGGAVDGNEDLNGNGRVEAGETDPRAAADDTDTDLDGIPDLAEATLLLDPANSDTDGDTILDGDEHVPGADGFVSDPLDTDSDDDGLGDGAEITIHRTDPSSADSDGDGIQDGTELGITVGFADVDGAGPRGGTRSQVFVPDLDPTTQTDPLARDTDEGGAPDGLEDLDHRGRRDGHETLPLAGQGVDDVDSDGDGIPEAVEVDAGTDPVLADSDGDGLSDGEELLTGEDGLVTDPLDGDTDDDGLSDGEEVSFGTLATMRDSDGDGLQDGTELGRAAGLPDTGAGFIADADPLTTTDPLRRDSDGGGIPDGLEDLNQNGSIDGAEGDPNLTPEAADADFDLLPDLDEPGLGANPAVADTDGDGLLDGEELIPGEDGRITLVADADTDDDGLSDGREFTETHTDPTRIDSDGDLVQDGTEYGLGAGIAGTGAAFQRDNNTATTTSPVDADTDEGGTWDGVEDADRDGRVDAGERDPRNSADDASADADADGLSAAQEAALGTDPLDADSDADGLPDGNEVNVRLTDPLDADDDDDGINDGEEVVVGVDGAITDPRKADTDGDGLQDGTELGYANAVPDPDGYGPVRGTRLDVFEPDRNPATRTSATLADTDGGGACDGCEDVSHDGRIDADETNPNVGADDTDGDVDGIPNAVEISIGTNPALADTDGDTLSDGQEIRPGTDGFITNPLDRDSDDDGLGDGNEVSVRLTNPSKADTDGDGLLDGLELGVTTGQADPDGNGPLLGTDSRVFRIDRDSASTTNARVADTDSGGVPDGNEDVNANGRIDSNETNPNAALDDGDAGDGDDIPDSIEAALGLSSSKRDTDGDGLADGEERIPGVDGVITDPRDADSDDDGLSDGVGEAAFDTDASRMDSDNDGVTDGIEAGITVPVPDPDGAGPLRGSARWLFQRDQDPATRTEPLAWDSDDGGLADGAEDFDRDGAVGASEGNPLAPADDVDGDSDGLSNSVEALSRTDPADSDTDTDGLPDGRELIPARGFSASNPLDADTDDDGVSDGLEVGARLDPAVRDTDGDGLADGVERGVAAGVADPDGAGILQGTLPGRFTPDADPGSITDALGRDTDQGGVADGLEDRDADGAVGAGEGDPRSAVDDADADRDGLSNAGETAFGTDAARPDTDGDGMDDGEELIPGEDGATTDALDRDTDDDGLSDLEELRVHRTRPDRADTDGDGLQDGTELGLVLGQPDPDAAGPVRGTDSGRFQPDRDPGRVTDPLDSDSDGGGACDGCEDVDRDGRSGGEADPGGGNAFDDSDLDADGVPDLSESLLGTAVGVADTDGDLLPDGEEIVPGADGLLTNPRDSDTDDDGLSDGEELLITFTSAMARDTDGDGLTDGVEAGRAAGQPDPDGSGPVRGSDPRRFVADRDPLATTDPLDSDSDDGGALDGNEDANHDGAVNVGETDPRAPLDDVDTDGDGLPDVVEPLALCDPADPDTDGDGLLDGEETLPGSDGRVSDPIDADSDDDGRSDGSEVSGWFTDPSNVDSDGDLLSDGLETGVLAYLADPDGRGPLKGTDRGVFVPDGDPLSSTSPRDPDTDEGGAWDAEEDRDRDGVVDATECDPFFRADDGPCVPGDADGDGLSDYGESVLGTDPVDPDTDRDGLADGFEIGIPTDPLDADSDDDGLSDAEEVEPGDDGLLTEPMQPDTDADGIQDGTEVGRSVGLPDPDAAGPARGTDGLVFRPDRDPTTTTDPTILDTDGGGVADGNEDVDANGRFDAGETSAVDPSDDLDPDSDGLGNAAEILYGTNPADADTDDDGLPDGEETIPGTDGEVTSPLDIDSDDDGLGDFDEIVNRGLRASRADSDSDGLPDGLEVGLTAGLADPDGAGGSLLGTNMGLFRPDLDPSTTTDPRDADTDDGGIADGLEDFTVDGSFVPPETDPLEQADDADADRDGLSDQFETSIGSDPANPDSDGDTLGDAEEVFPGADGRVSDPMDLDGDDDGLSDVEEIRSIGTDPSLVDTDLDGLQDGTEVGRLLGVGDPDGAGPIGGTDPLIFVSDADVTSTTDPLDADTDDGGVADGDEDQNRDGARDASESDPRVGADDRDFDIDGLQDDSEVAFGTDPFDADTDDDGILDGEEVKLGVDGYVTGPLDVDTDDDGLADGEERTLSLNPTQQDSDGDRVNDGVELGRTTPIPDPDGPGPLVATDPALFVADVDPSTMTLPNDPDSDDGGILDGFEDVNGNGRVDLPETDPNNVTDDAITDSDGDGWPDVIEAAFGTDPLDADADDDGLLDPLDGANDSDGDGLIDAFDPDSDDDGILDGTEASVTVPSADTDVSRGNFVPDADPTKASDPDDSDTDDGGVMDGAEDRNANGAPDGAETNVNIPDDDPLLACSAAPLFEVDGAPVHGVRVTRQGSDVVLTWTDEVAARPEPCLVYRVEEAIGPRPSTRAAFTCRRVVLVPTWRAVGVVGDGTLRSYLIVGRSQSAGEGSWGYAFDGTALVPR